MKKLLLVCSLALVTIAAQAVCTGSGTDVDAYYTSADTQHAIASMNQGYTWQCETTSAGVAITFTFLDAIDGMAAPYLFTFDNAGVLIGNPIQMSGWDAATRTATHTLTGYNNGDKLRFLVQVACADGKVLFSGRVNYEVGSDCTEAANSVVASCVDTLHTVDAYYSANNGKAATEADLVKGYVYTCSTMGNGDVVLQAKVLDAFAGIAAPMLFLFKDVDGNEQLDGDPIQMDWDGAQAEYTLTGKQEGEIIRFLVQFAYADGGVLFCDRISYEVGANCAEGDEPTTPDEPVNPDDPEDTALDEVKNAPNAGVKSLHNGQLIIERNNIRYTVLGTQL